MDVYGFGVRLGVYAENLSGLVFIFLRPDMLVPEAAGTNMFIAAITINLAVQTITSAPDAQGYLRSMTMLITALYYPALAMHFTDFLASRGSVACVLSMLYVALGLNLWFASRALRTDQGEHCLEIGGPGTPSAAEIFLLLAFSAFAILNLIRLTPNMIKQSIEYDHLRFRVPLEFDKLGMTQTRMGVLRVVGTFSLVTLTALNEYVMWRGGEFQVPYDLTNSGQMLPLLVGVCTLIRTIYMCLIKPAIRPLVYDPGPQEFRQFMRQSSGMSQVRQFLREDSGLSVMSVSSTAPLNRSEDMC
ncbi:hypothetical protein HDV00_005712 [Rhizophlyctis rosea]|nr:hypothetical protein HDV00_005712 [Rhizophlyctis rosea]